MSLQLVVLGGAAAWPNPGQGCSSYLVRAPGVSVVIDCGPDTLLELRRQTDYAAVDAIVVSHCHADHILDLVPYRYGLIYGPTRPARRIPVWLPPGGLDRMDMLGNAFQGQGEPYKSFWEDAFELREYDPAATLHLGPLGLHFTATQHFVECYAIRVDGQDGRSLCYSSDTGRVSTLVDRFRGADVLLVEATLDDHGDTPGAERGHLTPEDAGELATRSGASRLVVTHLWSERPDDEVVTRIRARYAGQIQVARPGLCVDV